MLERIQKLSVQDHHDRSPNTTADGPTNVFYKHSSGSRINTDTVVSSAIRAAYPDFDLTIVPQMSANLLGYASATGEAKFEPLKDVNDSLTEPLSWKYYVPPVQRMNGGEGNILDILKFGKFSYTHGEQQYIMYVVDGRDGDAGYPIVSNQYILHPDNDESRAELEKLVRAAGLWFNTLHEEIWVFDQGFWQKRADLWQSINKSRWEDVILEGSEKDDLRRDVKQFFDNRSRYERYRIAWKRGVIYYGPPGNGKTVSIKALSHELYQRENPIPTCYVRSLASFGGPESSIKAIFAKARAEAPCLLVFEDLDSLITDQVRSYFLNEIDGLSPNNGVYMIGSTNHMDRLDPGISKRPSRFDRKFNFPKPDLEQRTIYCEYWRNKLKKTDSDESIDELHNAVPDKEKEKADGSNDDNEDASSMVFINASDGGDGDDDDEIRFPKELSPEIAKITDGFSFAYLQEAFVATLLVIVDRQYEGKPNDHEEHVENNENKKKIDNQKDKFDDLLFWRVIKQQVAVLKEQI